MIGNDTKDQDNSQYLLSFYGIECPHCERMLPFIKKLEEEKGVKVEQIEVWHNEENARILEGYDKDGACGGVPFFYNTETKAWLCGEVTYEEIVEWAKK
jgi:thiol-disulfide isomerase/thioredoxin